MMNIDFKTWRTVKVIFVNEKEIELENIRKVKEDDSGYVHFVDWYGDDVFIVNGANMVGFLKQ